MAWSLDRNTLKALSLFLCWDFSSWQVTTIPVGTWVSLTAESVVLTDCPPHPELRKTSTRTSAGLISISCSSISGSTTMEMAEVWTRPWDSVEGILWTRCTPDSNFSFPYDPNPFTWKMISLRPPFSFSEVDMISEENPQVSANRKIMREASSVKSADSSPPTPALISTMQFFSSLGSLGMRAMVRFSSAWGSPFLASSSSALASSIISGSFSVWRMVSASSFWVVIWMYFWAVSYFSSEAFRFCESSTNFFWSEKISGFCNSASMAVNSLITCNALSFI